LSGDTNTCTIWGDNLNGPGAAETAPVLASPSTTGADMRHGTRFPRECNSEAPK